MNAGQSPFTMSVMPKVKTLWFIPPFYVFCYYGYIANLTLALYCMVIKFGYPEQSGTILEAFQNWFENFF